MATIGLPAARYSHNLIGCKLCTNGVSLCGVMQTSKARIYCGHLLVWHRIVQDDSAGRLRALPLLRRKMIGSDKNHQPGIETGGDRLDQVHVEPVGVNRPV